MTHGKQDKLQPFWLILSNLLTGAFKGLFRLIIYLFPIGQMLEIAFFQMLEIALGKKSNLPKPSVALLAFAGSLVGWKI